MSEVGIPTSPLAVDLTVEKEVVTVGPYARYAQKFLGVRGALSDKTLYSVKAARVALLDPRCDDGLRSSRRRGARHLLSGRCRDLLAGSLR